MTTSRLASTSRSVCQWTFSVSTAGPVAPLLVVLTSSRRTQTVNQTKRPSLRTLLRGYAHRREQKETTCPWRVHSRRRTLRGCCVVLDLVAALFCSWSVLCYFCIILPSRWMWLSFPLPYFCSLKPQSTNCDCISHCNRKQTERYQGTEE